MRYVFYWKNYKTLVITISIILICLTCYKAFAQQVKADETYILSVSTNGNVTKEPNKIRYQLNEKVTLTAIPETGYKFSGWSGDASGTEESIIITITKDTFITATFEELVMNISVEADNKVGDAPFDVSFSCTVKNGTPPYTYSWDFGDGSIGFGEKITHTYDVAGGLYKAIVLVQDALLNTANDSIDIFVVALSYMEISPTIIKLTQPDAVLQLLLKGVLNTGTPITPENNDIEWSTSNPDVATVSDGLVKAVSHGEADITAIFRGDSDGKLSASVKVQVDLNPVAINTSSMTFINKDQVYTPKIFIVYSDGTQKELTEFTLDFKGDVDEGSKVVQIVETTLTGIDSGNTIIKVTSDNLSTEFMIIVNEYINVNLTPSSFRTSTNKQLTVLINDGSPPYTSDTGTISHNLWTLTSPEKDGIYSYKVTDSNEKEANLTMTVFLPLTVFSSEGEAVFAVNTDLDKPVVLATSGGTLPYSWFATAGTLEILEEGALITYTPPALSGINTVTVTDQDGQVRSVVVSTETNNLITTPRRLYLSSGEKKTIEIFGGLQPYVVTANDGEVSEPAGGNITYTAPENPGDYLITITDANKITNNILVSVFLPLVVSPNNVLMGKKESQTFQINGGIGDNNSIFITADKGSVDAHPKENSFNYTAPNLICKDTLLITYGGGNQTKVFINIVDSNFFVIPQQPTLLMEEVRTFTTVGASVSNLVGWRIPYGKIITGQLKTSIIYTAPDTLPMDLIITATDISGKIANSTINVVSDQVKIFPKRIYLNPGEQAEFRGLFGLGYYYYYYNYAWTQGTGKVTDGVLSYTAPNETGVQYITLFDSDGNSAKAEVIIPGGIIKKKITETKIFTITTPNIYPASESQPVAVGDVQEGGTNFSMAFDFPNYKDTDNNLIPMNFYVRAHFKADNTFYYLDAEGGVYSLADIKPALSNSINAHYTQVMQFKFCTDKEPIDVAMRITAVAASYDPNNNLTLTPSDAPFEQWDFDFSFNPCE